MKKIRAANGGPPEPEHGITGILVNPALGGSEVLLRCFMNKTDILSLKLCYKVSLR